MTDDQANVTCAATTRSQTRAAGRVPTSSPLALPGLGVTREELIRLQKEDPQLREYFPTGNPTTPEGTSFRVTKSILYRHFKTDRHADIAQVVLPQALRSPVLLYAHDNPFSGHMGTRNTMQKVLSHFWWPGVRRDIRKYCQTCDSCQRTAAKGRNTPVPMTKMPIIGEPFQRIAIDLVGPLKPSSEEGHTHLLTVIDMASRYPEAVPLKKTDSMTIAEALITIFSRVGFPREILSDRGYQFTSDLMREVLKLLAIQPLYTTPYHAQTNGKVERFHGTLKPMLRRVISRHPRQWHRYIPAILFACRQTIKATTGFSPFELIYGRRARGPLDLFADAWTEETHEVEGKPLFQYVVDLKNILQEVRAQAQENEKNATEQYRKQYDKKNTARKFTEGEEALILLPTNHNKLLMQWKGPYTIVKCQHPDYLLDLPSGQKLYHINMLKQYHRREETSPVNFASAVEEITLPSTVPLPINFVEILSHEFCPQHPSTPNYYEPPISPTTHSISCNVAVLQSPESADDIPIPTVTNSASESSADIHINPDLPLPRQLALQKLFNQHKQILTARPGLFQGSIEHEIRLTEEKVVRQKPYPVPFALQQQIDEEIENMLELGVIEPSTSPYSSPVLLVKKKDRSVRFCVDYRALNQVTQFDAEPIPDPEAVYVNLANAKFFIKIDLAKGYWQIPVKREDRHKTAFQTTKGLFQWTRMPFGLVTAPATFARAIRSLQLEQYATYHFFDDLLVGSDSWENHFISP
ncbi:uncharacterized protein LOC112561350 [Pomacea canaliculata]|uniref:uncharacterized protein LOC112561350 n=1 Tax=Pomacea canaliculata TaxID=400727 RepID=UPI000D737A67|nr:uncharacterized protein LOC112561350 [Pomacea canaliculata]